MAAPASGAVPTARPAQPDSADSARSVGSVLSSSWADLVEERCRQTVGAGRWRQPRCFDAQGLRGTLAGCEQTVVSFAGNDYLGLSQHPAVIAAAQEAAARWGTGSGGSRLVTGSRPVHHQLETALAQWKHAEQAVVLPSGFVANLAALTTFGDATVRICSDERNHASIVDGARLARAEVTVYRHGDVDHLRRLMAGARGPVLVVTDTVFSMDGDEAPLAAIAECCRRSGALLVLDEAHGVLSPDLSPLLHDVACLRVGTLSKTLGSLGGFVAGSRRFVELMVNHARSYIFTTAPSPPDMAAALAALGVVQSAEGDQLRSVLASHVERLSPGQRAPIVPVVLGDEEVAVAASAALLDQGFWVPAIRPPTVPPGTSRLRVTLSAAHRSDEVEQLAQALEALDRGCR